MESVIETHLLDENKNASSVLFNSTYYLAKQEQPFSNFPNLFYLQEKNKTPSIKSCYISAIIQTLLKILPPKCELANCKYFCVLSDGSTDSSMIEEKLVYCYN